MKVSVSHFIKGDIVTGSAMEYGPAHARFATPNLDLDTLTWPRTEPGPAFDVPLAEIKDLLVATGERLTKDPSGLLAEACEQLKRVSTLDAGVLERAYATLGFAFTRGGFDAQIEQELGGPEVLDGWKEIVSGTGQIGRIRAFPPRLVHILAGNAPGVAALSIVRGALTKSVNLLKLPSNDLFSATAILRTMAEVAPRHPVVRSFSAVYWRGGDERVESMLFRPQFFDKLVAWGGESALRSAKNYIGPGFELVAFDPKTSISMIGREAFISSTVLNEVAVAGATDATPFNQQACVSSRIQYIEGSVEEIDRYCELLQQQLGVERPTCSVVGPEVPSELREQIEVLADFEPDYRVWGKFDGKGLVIRSHEPVDFYPDGKIVNVVVVRSLKEAIRYVNVATQTVGVYPPERKAEVRDLLASAGVQRVVTLGKALGPGPGFAHDGFYPLHRFVRWVNDED
ncbi:MULTISPECIES: acyl-CoA reductase [Paraburkholderia]|uniref:Long-chain-fatty-acyl-CoA reductase n=1 Tax=Paraburkholderia podalyriae TaxID=1938811 RepID=A0ABR7Q1J1_9BURK|nr:acyl-CoA reductase [Paraburkholderia podalyriae]MBC8752358.1 long-chain-fatty-acyl-CoA reductase [Paraburkholderia podalyriae]